MSKGFTDWTDLGIFPLQDVEADVPLGVRMAVAGGRVASRPDPGGAGGPKLTELAREHGLGTLGDLHPWLFWQTKEREKRAMGSWSMFWGAIVNDGATGGGRYAAKPSKLLPLTVTGGKAKKIVGDVRYRTIEPEWSKCLPTNLQGTMMVATGDTSEQTPGAVMLHADPRLVAVNVEGPAEGGTLVVDAQPEGELCMDDSDTPGKGGRHARLQSLVRVIALDANVTGALGAAELNGLALNYGLAEQDKVAGLGMVYGRGKSGGGGGGSGTTRPAPTKGPTTGTRTGAARGPGAGGVLPSRSGGFASGPGTANSGGQGGKGEDDERPLREFGEFKAAAQAGHAIGLMAGVQGCGPIVFGCTKHRFGQDADGHPITSAHIDTDALYHEDDDKDGPLLFEGEFPDDVKEHKIKTHVHLSFDKAETHSWCKGAKQGVWRWWTTVPYCTPTRIPNGQRPPTSRPTGPSTPGPGTPSPGTPAPPGGGPPTGPKRPRPTGPTRPPGNTPGIGAPLGGGPGSRPPGNRAGGPLRIPGGAGRSLAGGPNVGGPRFLEGDEGPPGGAGASYGGGYYFEQHTPAGKPGFGTPRGTVHNELEFDILGDYSGGPLGGPVGVINRVGGSRRGVDVGVFSILHPHNTGFAAVGFRPQLWINGAPNFEHNPELAASVIEAEELTRPTVLTLRAWGAQNESGDWNYTDRPELGRARGGHADGGVFFAPPEFEVEDYYGINSAADVRSAGTTSYVMCAPSVAFALGTPRNNGGLNVKSVIIGQVAADGTNDPLTIYQLNSSRVAVSMISARVDQTDGESRVTFSGTQSVQIPSGTTAQQPTTPVVGDLRFNTDDAALEVYGGSAWSAGIAASDVMLLSGANSMTGDLDLGGNCIATEDAVTNAATVAACVKHTSTGTPAAGMGTGLSFVTETAAGNNEVGSVIESVATDVTGAAEDFDLVFKGMTGGAAATEKMRLTSGGDVGIGITAPSDRLHVTSDSVADALRVDGTTGHVGIGAAPDTSATLRVEGDLEVADGYSTSGSARNAHLTVWSDNAFGMELAGTGTAPALRVFGRATDTDAIHFGTYTADSTTQSSFVQRAVLTSAGGLGVGVTAPAAGVVDALAGFADNGTAGIDKTFSFSDGALQTHSVVISGGIITQWDTLGE